LHSKEDNRDIRCWILASGKNLNQIMDEIKNDILSKINKKGLFNRLLQELGIKIVISNYDNPNKTLCSWTKINRIKLNLSRETLAKLTGTSGGDLNKIESGIHLPSCQKIRKFIQILGQQPFVFECKNNDFCLRSADYIFTIMNSKKKHIPLIIISELLNIWKQITSKSEKEFNHKKWEVLKNLDWLRVNQHCSKDIAAIKSVNKDLAKIIGAFAADGNFYPPDMIRWEEEYKDNMEALTKWLYNSFGIKIKVEKSNRQRNSYVFKFRNKIIARYLEIFFNFKPEAKTYTVDEPKIIRKCSLIIRKNFAKGAFMFDSGVNTDFTVSFYSASKKFRDSLAEIIENDLEIIASKSENKHKLWSIVINVNPKNQRILKYFERGTSKWQKLNEFINGFNFSVKNLEEVKIILDNVYPKLRHNTFSEILDTIKNENKFSLYEVLSELNISRPSLQRRIRILIHANILTKKKERRNIYNFNKNIKEWKLPNPKRAFD